MGPTLLAILTASTLREASRSAPLNTLPSLSTAASAIVCTLWQYVLRRPGMIDLVSSKDAVSQTFATSLQESHICAWELEV